MNEEKKPKYKRLGPRHCAVQTNTLHDVFDFVPVLWKSGETLPALDKRTWLISSAFLCIYICIYMCIYMYIYVYVYICIYMYIYIYVYICKNVYICIYMYIYVHICTYKYVYVYVVF